MTNSAYKVMKYIGGFQLFEVATETVIMQAPTERELQRKAKFFTRGGGFFGWTPKFMTVSAKQAAA